jgi:hypothetical protein
MPRSSLPRRSPRAPLPLSRRLFSTSSRRATTAAPPPPRSDRIQRILRRIPKFLRPTISALHNAPLTHITAFLILHELTAIVPIFGLVGAFHYFQWLPPFFAEGKWVVAGVEKFGNYFRRKGWIEAGDKREAKELAEDGQARDVEAGSGGVGYEVAGGVCYGLCGGQGAAAVEVILFSVGCALVCEVDGCTGQ